MNHRRLVAEFVGTALLLVAIVGSGIATSVDGSASSQLFQHAVVVGAALAALIFTFGPVSGAHLNPSVTFADAVFGGLKRRLALGYAAAQLGGAMVGVAVANAIFGEPPLEVATVERVGIQLFASEALATFGLVVVIFGTVRFHNPRVVPVVVGAYLTAAIFFTSSASFANPVATVGRMFTGTWSGIAPAGVAYFLAGQAAGTLLAVGLIGYLFRPSVAEAEGVVVPQDDAMREETKGEPRHQPDRT